MSLPQGRTALVLFTIISSSALHNYFVDAYSETSTCFLITTFTFLVMIEELGKKVIALN